jgi:hypothetical protein
LGQHNRRNNDGTIIRPNDVAAASPGRWIDATLKSLDGLFVCRGSPPILRLNNRAMPIGPGDDPLDPRSLSQVGPVNSHHVLYRHPREQPIHRRRHRGSRP